MGDTPVTAEGGGATGRGLSDDDSVELFVPATLIAYEPLITHSAAFVATAPIPPPNPSGSESPLYGHKTRLGH